MSHLIEDQESFYSNNWSSHEISRWQLGQFNSQWDVIRCDIPYYANLANHQRLATKFNSWEEVKNLVPVTNRKTVQSFGRALSNVTKSPDFSRITGGSTAEPVQLPAWKSELNYGNKDLWYARSWFNVDPSDKLFLIWGHRHLLGFGAIGWFNKQLRSIKDNLAGYYRFSAYDLNDEQLRKAGDILLEFRPTYIISYAGALDRFCRVNENRASEFRDLHLKVAIATTESYP
ncbi:MAG: hypothetical protein V3U73_08760, partial [bacterium]